MLFEYEHLTEEEIYQYFGGSSLNSTNKTQIKDILNKYKSTFQKDETGKWFYVVGGMDDQKKPAARGRSKQRDGSSSREDGRLRSNPRNHGERVVGGRKTRRRRKTRKKRKKRTRKRTRRKKKKRRKKRRTRRKKEINIFFIDCKKICFEIYFWRDNQITIYFFLH